MAHYVSTRAGVRHPERSYPGASLHCAPEATFQLTNKFGVGWQKKNGKKQIYGIRCVSRWASLVAQLVKNPPAMQETTVWSLGWEDPLEKGTATHSSMLAWRIPGTG